MTHKHANLADASIATLASALNVVCEGEVVALMHVEGARRRADRAQLVTMWRATYAEGDAGVRRFLTRALDASL